MNRDKSPQRSLKQQGDGDSPPDDVFRSPRPQQQQQQQQTLAVSFSFASPADSHQQRYDRSGDENDNRVADTSTSTATTAATAKKSRAAAAVHNPFHEVPVDQPPKFCDCGAQTDIRLGEWLLRDASVPRSSYLEVKNQLRHERITFLKEASLLRQTLSRLESTLNRGGGGGGAFSSSSTSAAHHRGARASSSSATAAAIASRNNNNNNYNNSGGTTIMLNATSSNALEALGTSNNLFLLDASVNNTNNNARSVVSVNGPSSSFGDAPSSLSPHRQQHVVVSPVALTPSLSSQQQQQQQQPAPQSTTTTSAFNFSPQQQQHLQYSATIQATASSVMLLMNEAAKALSVVSALDELEEKHAAEITELRMKMTEAMDELKKKHQHEMGDVASELALLRIEAASAARSAGLERERLVHQMERTTWDSVQSLKQQAKNLEQELEGQREAMVFLRNENRELKKEVQNMKADQITLQSEKRRLEQRLLGSSGTAAAVSAAESLSIARIDDQKASSSSPSSNIFTNVHHHDRQPQQILYLMDKSNNKYSASDDDRGSWGYGVVLERESDHDRNTSRYDGTPKQANTSKKGQISLGLAAQYQTARSKPCEMVGPADKLLVLTMKSLGIPNDHELQGGGSSEKRNLLLLASSSPTTAPSSVTPQKKIGGPDDDDGESGGKSAERPFSAHKPAFNPPRVASMTSASSDQMRRSRFSIGIGGRGGDVALRPAKATSTTARINNTIGKDIWGTRNEKRRIVLGDDGRNKVDLISKAKRGGDEDEQGDEEKEGGSREGEPRQQSHKFGFLGGEPDVVLLGE